MLRFLPFIGMAAVLVSLASCNSMSKEECRVADWKVVGDTDGAAGYNPQTRFADHVKSCSKTNVSPDQTRWYEGYQSGILRYCTPLSGANSGEAGKSYHNVCSPELEPEFMRGYSIGKRVYDLRSRFDQMQSSIRYRDSEIDRSYNELKVAKDDQRRVLRNQIDDMERENRRQQREADDVEYELGHAQRELGLFYQGFVSRTPAPRG